MKVYLIEDCANTPGKIYAIFADEEEEAFLHMEQHDLTDDCQIVERTLCYGQQPTEYVV